MGQIEVLKILEKEKRPICRRQIADKLKTSPIKVSHILNKLLKMKEICCVEYDRIQTAKMLGLKSNLRRTRFFYIPKSSSKPKPKIQPDTN